MNHRDHRDHGDMFKNLCALCVLCGFNFSDRFLNQQNDPLSIKAQITSGDQILEEKSFVLEKLGARVEFSNETNHFVNSTNVTLILTLSLRPWYDIN